MARRSPAKPGDSIPFRLKKDEDQDVIDWINNQDNINDSFRFLIQMDVARNGKIINQQEIVAQSRSKEYIQQRVEDERRKLLLEAGNGQMVEGLNFDHSAYRPSQGNSTSQRQKSVLPEITEEQRALLKQLGIVPDSLTSESVVLEQKEIEFIHPETQPKVDFPGSLSKASEETASGSDKTQLKNNPLNNQSEIIEEIASGLDKTQLKSDSSNNQSKKSEEVASDSKSQKQNEEEQEAKKLERKKRREMRQKLREQEAAQKVAAEKQKKNKNKNQTEIPPGSNPVDSDTPKTPEQNVGTILREAFVGNNENEESSEKTNEISVDTENAYEAMRRLKSK